VGGQLRGQRAVHDRERSLIFGMTGRRAAGGTAVAVASIIGTLFLPQPLQAAGAGSAPAPALNTQHHFPNGYFEYTAAAGATINDTVLVGNGGASPGSFYIYSSDGVTSPATGVVYADRVHPLPDGPAGNGEYGAGAWIHLSVNSLRVDPGAQIPVTFSATVPASVHPGDWVGSISSEITAPQSVPTAGAVGLRVIERTTLAVVIHVPGDVDRTSVTVGAPSVKVDPDGRQVVNIPLQYLGDVLLKPVMHFRLTDQRGNVLAKFDGQYDTFMPHTTLLYSYPLTAPLGQGTYEFSGDFGATGHLKHFDYKLTIGSAQVAPPRPAPEPTTAPQDQAWWLPLLLIIPLLIVGTVLLVLALRRDRCTHCGQRRLRGLLPVRDYLEVAGCISCRALARDRASVRLCRECYSSHVKGGVLVTESALR
jgi:hypothetical protein